MKVAKDLSVTINAGLAEAVLRLHEVVKRAGFEIISESELGNSVDDLLAHRTFLVVCRYGNKKTREVLKNMKSLYVPTLIFLMEEMGQNSSEVTVIDAGLAKTDHQRDRMKEIIPDLMETAKNIVTDISQQTKTAYKY